MTKVIGLFAGPGAGKSTTAAKLFAQMKERGYKVELVQEYVKGWAWEDKKITEMDSFYLLAKQMKAEGRLYGKVDYIITDSPIGLSAVYDKLYNNSKCLYPPIQEFLRRAKNKYNVERLNIFIERNKPYYKHGRYQEEAEAKKLDVIIKEFITTLNFPFSTVSTGEVDKIMELLESD